MFASVFLLNIVYFSVCLTSNKLYWIDDQLADVSIRFYTSASWRRRVGPSASWLVSLLNWGIICRWSLLSYYGPHPITGRLWCTFAVAICWLAPQTFLRNCLASIWRLPFSLDSFRSFPNPMQYLLACYTISHTLISFHLYLPTSDTVSQLLSCFNFNHVFTYPSNNPVCDSGKCHTSCIRMSR